MVIRQLVMNLTPCLTGIYVASFKNVAAAIASVIIARVLLKQGYIVLLEEVYL